MGLQDQLERSCQPDLAQILAFLRLGLVLHADDCKFLVNAIDEVAAVLICFVFVRLADHGDT